VQSLITCTAVRFFSTTMWNFSCLNVFDKTSRNTKKKFNYEKKV
jgi:hypothetical protein